MIKIYKHNIYPEHYLVLVYEKGLNKKSLKELLCICSPSFLIGLQG